MSQGSITLIATGGRQGKTFQRNGFQFVNGKCPLRGDLEKLAGPISYLGRTIRAYPENSDELIRAAEQGLYTFPEVESDDPDPVEEDQDNFDEDEIIEESDEDIGDINRRKIAHALLELDPKNEEHWTEDGKPSVDVVSKLSGVHEVTRVDIDFINPEFSRE